ncbi:MAG: AEC family transporter [Candidatus Eiseniibacteriota bacterium]|jgi:hypothetical protein
MHPVVAEILVSVGKTFAVMGIGVAFRRFWSRDISAVNDLAMQLFVPCLAFSAILNQELAPHEFGRIAAAAGIVIAGVLILALAVFRLTGLRGRGPVIAAVFANCANLPFPILEANYGATGLGYGVVYYLVNHLSMFSIGILLLTRSIDLGALLRVPVFVVSLAAILLTALDVPVPSIIADTAELLGDAAIPLILFTFGYSLAGVRLGAWRATLLVSTLRLAGGLACGLLAVTLLGLDGIQRDVVILVSAMPSAVINVVVTGRYRAEPELVASVVFVTTAAALVIVPLLLVWLRT